MYIQIVWYVYLHMCIHRVPICIYLYCMYVYTVCIYTVLTYVHIEIYSYIIIYNDNNNNNNYGTVTWLVILCWYFYIIRATVPVWLVAMLQLTLLTQLVITFLKSNNISNTLYHSDFGVVVTKWQQCWLHVLAEYSLIKQSPKWDNFAICV